jgi:hypothetical protein
LEKSRNAELARERVINRFAMLVSPYAP